MRSKREKAFSEEGADEIRPTSQGEANARFEDLGTGRAPSHQGALFHPSPPPLVRVQLVGVGRQAVDAEAVPVFPQGGSGRFPAVSVESVQEQEDRPRDRAEQVADESDELGAADRAPLQPKGVLF